MYILLLILAIILLFFMLWSPKMGYIPDKAGSGGLNPNGGMRSAKLEQTELHDRNVVYNEYDVDIYDHEMIPEKMVWDIGHWSE